MAKNDKMLLTEYLKKIRKVLIKINIPLIIAFLIMYPLFVKVFMPIQFDESFVSFYIIMVGITFASVYFYCGAFLFMGGYPATHLLGVIILFVVSIFANYVLIPIWGLAGAAIATSIYYVSMILIMNILIKWKTGIRIIT